MRTTLDIEEDVLLAVKEIARRRGVSIGKVLSELARQALSRQDAGTTYNGVPLFPIQPEASVVTLELVNQLREEAP
ncbi:MAG: CopG family transcriptional regulator [Scytonema sp. PMC 1069.18]|nr:CopG family transcriptional regulator [Scytonema sp. PMC 1069.18]MEC4885978.1 CopG family transcriptional regulator [Scytonema sp. PMC 1070.18]